MTTAPFDSAILGPYFADPEITAAFSDSATARAMLAVEGALARAQGALGIIPPAAAQAIAMAAENLQPDLDALGAGTAATGVPVIALVAQLRAAAGRAAADYVHLGATSQDIIDTGLILRLRQVLAHLEAGLDGVVAHLARLADSHRATMLAARTRSQQAVPTTLGLKAAGWLAPLLRQRRRLDELRPRLLWVPLGGAGGTLAAHGERDLALAEALAEELELIAPAGPWHGQRDGLAELAGWLSLLTGVLGKMGGDLVALAQGEVAEVAEGGEGRGGSSAMPQKANPVTAELLVALARTNAGLLATMHHALIHEHERDGAAWSLEWAALPQMAAAAGGALRAADGLLERLDIRAGRMAENLAAGHGLILAEAAVHALAAHMPRAEARALVGQACATVAAEGRHLVDVLRETSDAAVDWDGLARPENYLGAADAIIDRVLAAANAGDG